MKIHIITTEGELPALVGHWKVLHLETGRTVFTHPGFLTTWWDIYGRTSNRALHIATGWVNGRLVALAPLVVVRRYGLRFLEWAGANVFDYSDTLLDADTDAECFWNAIRSSSRFDIALLRGVNPSLTCNASLARFAKPSRRRVVHRISLGWPSGDAWMEETISTKQRKALRWSERQINKRGELALKVHQTGPVPVEVVDALVRQKTVWAGRNGGTGLFDDPQAAVALLQRVAASAAESRHLHLSWLCSGDQIIAVHFGFVHRELLYYYMPSYDVEWGRFSPGKILMIKLITWCIENGLTTFDFMQGDHSYKSDFANTQVEQVDFSFPASIVGRIFEPFMRKAYLEWNQPGAAEAEPSESDLERAEVKIAAQKE